MQKNGNENRNKKEWRGPELTISERRDITAMKYKGPYIRGTFFNLTFSGEEEERRRWGGSSLTRGIGLHIIEFAPGRSLSLWAFPLRRRAINYVTLAA